MKKYVIALAVFLVIVGGISLAKILYSVKSDAFFRSNVEALAQSEGYYPVCTGPKKENLSGNIFCHCENSSPCKDNQGCQ